MKLLLKVKRQARAQHEAFFIIRGERMKRKSFIFQRVFIMGVMLALIGQACTFTLFKNPFETTPAAKPVPESP